MQHFARLRFRAKHEGSRSFVDLTTETKAQFFLSTAFTKGYRSISHEAQTIKETCLSALIHQSVF